MKTSFVVMGCIFFCVAIIGLLMPIFGNNMSILQGYNLCNSAAGSIGQALSNDAKTSCENVYSFLGPIFLLGFIGFILFLVGLLKKNKLVSR